MKIAQSLWKGKQKDSDSRSKEQLIMQYAPLVKFIAHRIAMRLPSNIDVNDLINSGIIGLMDAIEKYDPSRKNKFETYAEFRIRGAILDELRALDWAPRSFRRKAHQMEKIFSKLEKELGRPATDEEAAEAMGMDMEEYFSTMEQLKGISLLSLEELKSIPEDDRGNLLNHLAAGNGEDPLSLLNLGQLKEALAKALEELPERDRLVITLYYYEELNMKEIARILDITESRISQIHTRAILRLRGKLQKFIQEIVD